MIRRPRSDRFFAGFSKQVSKEYGVLLERLGAALRGTFLIDPDGLVLAYMVQDLTVGRSVDEILRLVSSLKTGKLWPVGWRAGEPFLPPIPKNTVHYYGAYANAHRGAAGRREPFTVAGIPTDYMVPEEGVEPSRPCGHGILSPARLPVPPLRLVGKGYTR